VAKGDPHVDAAQRACHEAKHADWAFCGNSEFCRAQRGFGKLHGEGHFQALRRRCAKRKTNLAAGLTHVLYKM